MAKIISFISEKGGVGKTTTVYHIAVGLRLFHDVNVLVIDTDYQRGGLTCRLRPEMLENFRLGDVPHVTLYHAYRALYSGQDVLPVTVLPAKKDKIDLVPADPRLNSISVDKMPPTNNLRDNNRMIMRHLTLIRDCLERLVGANRPYDFVLIDSHPDLYDLEKAVIYASDYCVSPVKLDAQSAIGVPSTIEAIKNVDADVKAVGSLLGLLPGYKDTVFLGAIGMMCREWGGGLKYSETITYNRLKRTTGIFDTYITEGDGIRWAAEQGCSVYDISGVNAEKQAEQFRQLINELLSKL
ncbi:MAG: ParA family protein [Chloroflexi bacterium]|nr:ParA family protein [Chloroflexota bacterium]